MSSESLELFWEKIDDDARLVSMASVSCRSFCSLESSFNLLSKLTNRETVPFHRKRRLALNS